MAARCLRSIKLARAVLVRAPGAADRKIGAKSLINPGRFLSTQTQALPSAGSLYESSSPYARRPLGRDWTEEELNEAVAEGYRHPKVDVDYYLQERELEKAMEVFEGFKAFADTETWTKVLWAHGRTGHLKEMAELYVEMTREHNVLPSEITFCTIIKAMNRAGAYEAVFAFYAEEIKPREYVRLCNLTFQKLFETCYLAERVDALEAMWADYHGHYERKSNELLWMWRLKVASRCEDWALVQTICSEMDEQSLRMRVPAFRAILGLIPDDESLPAKIANPARTLKHSFTQYSVKPRKEKRSLVFFMAQLELFDLVKECGAYLKENGLEKFR